MEEVVHYQWKKPLTTMEEVAAMQEVVELAAMEGVIDQLQCKK